MPPRRPRVLSIWPLVLATVTLSVVNVSVRSQTTAPATPTTPAPTQPPTAGGVAGSCQPSTVADLVLVTLAVPATEYVSSFRTYLTLSRCVNTGPYARHVLSSEPYNASLHGDGGNFIFADCPLGCIDRGSFAVPSTARGFATPEVPGSFDLGCASSNCFGVSGQCVALPACQLVLAQAIATGVMPAAFNPANAAVFTAGLPIAQCIDRVCGGTLVAQVESGVLNGSEALPSTSEEVRHVNLVAAALTSLPDDVFGDLHDLRELSLLRNMLTELPVGVFRNNSRLQFLYLSGNRLQSIRAGTFSSQRQLRQLWLPNNHLTVVEDGACAGLSQLEDLVLGNNRLAAVPPAVRGLGALRELWLNQNRLTRIGAPDFSGLTSLYFLTLDHNAELTAVATAAFAGLPGLGVAWQNYSTRSLLGIGFDIRAVDPTAPHPLALSSGLPPLTINPAPVACEWLGPEISNIDCTACSFGYTLVDPQNTSAGCELPTFQPWAVWDPSPLVAQLSAEIFLRNPIRLSPPDLAPKKERFVGYSDSNYMQIRYELDFPTDVTLGCGVPVTGDTSTVPAAELNATVFDRVHRSLQSGFVDRPKDLRFRVTVAGFFTFDSCDSLYTTSLTLYRDTGGDPMEYDEADMVDPDAVPDAAFALMRVNFPQAEDWDNVTQQQMVWSAGCSVSASARRTVFLEPDTYLLRVRGSPFQNDTGGVYLVQMECHGEAETWPTQRDPGGIAVDAETGAVSGTPEVVGSGYNMRLSAVDRVGTRAEVASWVFNVSERLFDTSADWISSGLDASRNILAKYHVNQFHELRPPAVRPSVLFVHPAHGDFGGIVYLLVANRTGDTDAPASAQIACSGPSLGQLFTDVVSGGGALKFECTGRYSATLKARDSDGFETVVNSWDFEVRRVDTDVPAYGPGGRTCAHGTAIDGTAMDGAFSCNCSGSFYTGPNCDRFAAAATSSGRSGASETGFFAVIGVAVGVIVVVLVVLVVLGLRARNTRRKPKDFAEILAQLQAAGVLPKDADITPGAGAVPEELPRTSVAVGEEIGNGHFGAVRRGLLTHKFAATSNSVYTKVDVAIKVLLDDTAQGTLDFMRESAVTWQFNHPNVVQMFGVVTMGSPHMLVLELCHNGSLLGYLRRHGEGVETFQRIRFLQDIASGMHHLSGKGFVHRDLAARNVLLNAELVAKVADFGLGRELEDADYYRSTAESMVLPLRWTDPDVFETNRFSEATDVWAFGVLGIEVFTDGVTPYRGWTNMFIIEQLKEGYRLPRPDACPQPVYNTVIRRCWSDTEARPTFEELSATFASRTHYGVFRTASHVDANSGGPSRIVSIPSIVVDPDDDIWAAPVREKTKPEPNLLGCPLGQSRLGSQLSGSSMSFSAEDTDDPDLGHDYEYLMTQSRSSSRSEGLDLVGVDRISSENEESGRNRVKPPTITAPDEVSLYVSPRSPPSSPPAATVKNDLWATSPDPDGVSMTCGLLDGRGISPSPSASSQRSLYGPASAVRLRSPVSLATSPDAERPIILQETSI